MHVFVTGASGHNGSHIVSELISAGHEVTGLARSDAAAAAVSALGAKVLRGELDDLDALKRAAIDSAGVIHTAFDRRKLGADLGTAVAADLASVYAFGEALAGSGRPLVVAGSLGAPGHLGRPATENDPAIPSGEEHRATLRGRNNVEIAVLELAKHDVRTSVVRLPPVSHSDRDRTGFLAALIALAKQKGFSGYPGDGTNRWSAVATPDVAVLFRLALENARHGTRWHAVGDHAVPFRDIAQAIGDRLGVRTDAVPADQVQPHFGFLAVPVTLDVPAVSLITRQTLGWEPIHPGVLADLDNGHYFPTTAE
jgi:nucleoside-diphosphate-sugar epimerase